jgi:hypothetical protein
MIRTAALMLFVVAQLPLGSMAATCDGANVTVTHVTVATVTRTRYLNLYHVTATVTNLGNAAQAANVMQFTDVKQYGDRLDDRGIPPLGPNQSYTVSYTWRRAVDAGNWTTPLDFQIRLVSPAAGGDNCAASNVSSITF